MLLMYVLHALYKVVSIYLGQMVYLNSGKACQLPQVGLGQPSFQGMGYICRNGEKEKNLMGYIRKIELVVLVYI